MTKGQELKMALYDYLEEKNTLKITTEERNILKSLDVDKEVIEINDKRFKEYRMDIK